MNVKTLFFDNSPDRKITLDILEEIGLDVVSGASKRDVIEKLNKGEFSILITDINFHDDELESFLFEIEQISKSKNICHIAVTGNRDIFDISLAETYHVRPILLKPVDKDILVKTLKFLCLERKNGILLCPPSSKPLFQNSFLSMGLNVDIILTKLEFNQVAYDKKFDFVVYETGFSEIEIKQLLNRLLSLSDSIKPVYLFLKKDDVILRKQLADYGPFMIQLPPWDFSVMEEQIQNLILESYEKEVSSQGNKDKNKAKIEEEKKDVEKLIETSEIKEEKKETPLNRFDETQSGKISLSSFLNKLDTQIQDDAIANPLILYFKRGQNIHKQRCIETLTTKKGEKYIPPLISTYKDGSDALREVIIELFADFPVNQMAMSCLCGALNDRLPSIQLIAVLGLKNYKITQVAPYLQKKLLGATEPKVKQSAAKLLESLKDIRMFDTFATAVINSTVLPMLHSFVNYVKLNFKSIKDMNLFTPLFNSDNNSLKEMLIEFFISSEDKRVFPFLYNGISSKNRVLIRLSIEGIKSFSDMGGIPYLLNLLESKDGSLAENAIISIMRNNVSPKYSNVFLLIVNKTDDRIKEEVIDLVKGFKEDDNRAILEACIKSGGTGTKLAAIEAMEKWDKKNIILTIGTLLDDSDRLLSDHVYSYMKENYDKSLIETFIRVFLTVKKANSKETIVYLLADLIQNENPNSLLKFCKKDSYSVLIKILKGYGVSLGKFTSEVLGSHIKDPESLEIVLKSLYENDVEAKSEAAFILGENNFKEAIPHLVKFIDNSNWHVRRMVIEALGKLKAKETMPLILKKIKDENTGVRVASAHALNTLGLRFKESLIPMFIQEDSVKVLEELSKLFSPFRDQKTADVYLPKLSATNILTRINAFTYLLPLWDNLDKNMIYSWLESKNWKIRLLALSYFSKENPETIIDSMNVYIMDKSEDVRKFLIDFISQHQSDNLLGYLNQFTKDESPLVRQQIIFHAVKNITSGTLDFLIAMFENEENDEVLLSLLDAFDQFEDNQIAELLDERIEDFTNPNIQKKAYDILSKYSDGMIQ